MKEALRVMVFFSVGIPLIFTLISLFLVGIFCFAVWDAALLVNMVNPPHGFGKLLAGLRFWVVISFVISLKALHVEIDKEDK